MTRLAIPSALLCLALASCGGAPATTCGYFVALKVGPAAAIADHAAAPPGSQQQFSAFGEPQCPATCPDCPLPQLIASLQPQWTSSSPLEVKISSAPDSTNGLATCLTATTSPVTLTATTGTTSQAPKRTAIVTLTCK